MSRGEHIWGKRLALSINKVENKEIKRKIKDVGKPDRWNVMENTKQDFSGKRWNNRKMGPPPPQQGSSWLDLSNVILYSALHKTFSLQFVTVSTGPSAE